MKHARGHKILMKFQILRARAELHGPFQEVLDESQNHFEETFHSF